jgi:hypothetical protein
MSHMAWVCSRRPSIKQLMTLSLAGTLGSGWRWRFKSEVKSAKALLFGRGCGQGSGRNIGMKQTHLDMYC